MGLIGMQFAGIFARWMAVTSLLLTYLVASESIVDALTRHLLAKAWIQKKRGCIYCTHVTNRFPKTKRWRCHSSVCFWFGNVNTLQHLMGSLPSRFPVGSGSRSRITWPQKPAQVVVQRRGSLRDTEPEKISLRTLIETRCPSVLTPFKSAWWLFKYALGPLCRH